MKLINILIMVDRILLGILNLSSRLNTWLHDKITSYLWSKRAKKYEKWLKRAKNDLK